MKNVATIGAILDDLLNPDKEYNLEELQEKLVDAYNKRQELLFFSDDKFTAEELKQLTNNINIGADVNSVLSDIQNKTDKEIENNINTNISDIIKNINGYYMKESLTKENDSIVKYEYVSIKSINIQHFKDYAGIDNIFCKVYILSPFPNEVDITYYNYYDENNSMNEFYSYLKQQVEKMFGKKI